MLEFEVDFADALIDVERKVTLKGASAHAEVVIQTKTERAGQIWRSQITVQADEKGQVDLAQIAPLAGSYTQKQSMGLIYTQVAENAAATELFPHSVHHPVYTEIEAKLGDQVAQTVLTQRLTHNTVQRVELVEKNVKGVMFVPGSAGDKPAIVVLKHNASKPIDEAQAALYAARGYTALALDYTYTPALDAELAELEVFQLALQWLRDNVTPKNNFVAVSGYGEGAELALLLGVRLNTEVSAIIACEPTTVAPSSYPLEVEQCLAPLLLASGQLHTSSQYQRSIGQRLQQHGFDYNFQWYDYEGVAQGLSFPHVPTRHLCSSSEQALLLAKANKDVWFAIIGFLHQAVLETGRPQQLHA